LGRAACGAAGEPPRIGAGCARFTCHMPASSDDGDAARATGNSDGDAARATGNSDGDGAAVRGGRPFGTREHSAAFVRPADRSIIDIYGRHKAGGGRAQPFAAFSASNRRSVRPLI